MEKKKILTLLMVRGYENISKILSGNREGFLIQSPNLFNIEFFDLMQEEFWLPTRNNSINLLFLI